MVMLWSGYAATKLKITLQDFQVRAIHTYNKRKDAIIIQATGSGKSTCFQVPIIMLQPDQYALVIIPTVALGNDHRRTFQELAISSVFLSSSSSKADYLLATGRSKSTENRPSVVILTPETLFGDGTRKGIIDQLPVEALKLIVIDEAHLVFEWAAFRGAFKQIVSMKKTFTCPIKALTATMKPKNLREMQQNILRDPVIIKGSVDRPNVVISISPYRFTSDTQNAWTSVAKQIQDLVKDEVSIVYCAYAKECEDLNLNFLELGISASCYTGKQTSATDKKEIYNSMKNGNIQILVATKAFGMGINLQDIRHIVHVGIPENLSLWVQELGRAGRDGKLSYAHLLINENQDMKKLAFWISNSSKEEREVRIEDYQEVWRYISTAFTGGCLRQFQLNYFEDNIKTHEEQENRKCCVGCDIRTQIPYLDNGTHIRSVLGCINVLNEHGIEKVYEGKIVDWIGGTMEEWMGRYFNEVDLKKEPTFSYLKHLSRLKMELIVKGVLRQCLAKKYVHLQFQYLPNSKIMSKCWILSDLGRQVLDEEIELQPMPEPDKVAELLLK